MYKKQMLFERILCLGAIIIAALTLLYALGMITDVYDCFRLLADDETGTELLEGAMIAYDMQPFIASFITYSIVAVIVSVTLFITLTNKRRKYYISNYLSSALVAAAFIALGVWAIIRITGYRNAFLDIDFDKFYDITQNGIGRYKEGKGGYFTESTFWFDIGYVVAGLLILSAVLLIFNLFWKRYLESAEKKLLKGSIHSAESVGGEV